MTSDDMAVRGGHLRHLAIAERGKLSALSGDHDRALELYRLALHQAREMGAPPPFARHYTDCILESLERQGRHADALALVEAACAELQARGAASALQRHDHAVLTLRRAILLLFLERGDEAGRHLAEAIELASPARLALAEELVAWRSRALTLTEQTLTDALSRHGYYTVRRGRIRADLARTAVVSPARSRQEVT
ncbi:hypothetical protein [Halomonas alimentaria]|uniref:MalT-like TPR region domain-containing protein n=1 Tax=Halomonas alimentaria TaxID=147248 RepID=A0A7X5AQQ4_9GAMM|nr:hypothetical protein [Halomonas alimentaria]NAW35734.1 hypothetical protein [Halomonas alimentaria]